MFASGKTSAASTGGYQISRSLRFNSADSANLNRTPSVAANQQIWTFSIWLKRSRIGADYEGIFSSGNGTDQIRFENNDVFRFGLNGSSSADFLTTQVFRDVSAWYHIVVAVDTTQATSTNRVKIYVNGTQVTSFSTANYPSQNYNTFFNNTADHRIGSASTSAYYFNGYMTEFNWIGGTQLTPSSFGETNAQTGVWQPKAYSGSYGTNGFYLNFSDNSNTTAATLGKDYSGNGNNWTPNNFSVTAGAGNDSLVDSPTSYGVDTGAGGTVRGNYCTLNPLYKNGAGTPAYTNGNLDMLAGGTGDSYFGGTFAISSGKWYYECLINAVGTGGTSILIGICKTSAPNGVNIGSYRSTSEIYNLDGTAQTAGATYAAGDTIGVAIDIDAGTVKFYKNNTGQGATPSFTFTAGTEVFVRGRSDSANPSATFNFGQRAFAYTAPSGFKALCTQNLPTPTIGATTATQAGKYFNPVLYTGTGASLGVTGVGFQPDLVWIKKRSGAESHNLFDVVRGSPSNFLTLQTNTTGADTTPGITMLSALNSDGFTLGANGAVNESTFTFVSWNWKANGSGSTNTAGSITSTVSANTTSGFSVVTWTGNNGSGTVGHGLGVAPAMYIVKNRTNAGGWVTYHSALGATKYLTLQSTDSATTSSIAWNDTAPTSSVFSIASGAFGNTNNYVTYCFAPVAGYSAFGSYTGNGSADGPFVFTGMRPAYVMVKVSSAAAPWIVFDAVRNPSNAADLVLRPNTSTAEGAEVGANPLGVDFLSNGFKIRTSDAWVNPSAGTIIYAAFASAPQKFSLAR